MSSLGHRARPFTGRPIWGPGTLVIYPGCRFIVQARWSLFQIVPDQAQLRLRRRRMFRRAVPPPAGQRPPSQAEHRPFL
eukprot:6190785-Pleurochrysis_carterae.AAC.1